MKKTLLFVLLSFGTVAFAQTAHIPDTILDGMMEETHYQSRDFNIEKSNLNKHLGEYHFGESEGEWSLKIAKTDEGYSAKITYQVYNTKKNTFDNKVAKFKVAKFSNGQIFFGNYKAFVATYKDGKDAILVYGNPTENKVWKNQVFVGFKN